MKKTIFFLSLVTIGFATQAQEKAAVSQLLYSGPTEVRMPVFSNVKKTEGNIFEAATLIKTENAKADQQTPRETTQPLNGVKWSKLTADTAGWINVASNSFTAINRFAFYLQPNRFMKGKITIQTPNRAEIYLDGKKVADKTSVEREISKAKSCDASVTLENRKYLVEMKLLSTPSDSNAVAVNASISVDKGYSKGDLAINNSFERPIILDDVLSAEQLSGIFLSPSGRYGILRYSTFGPKGKSSSRSEVIEMATGRLAWSLRESKIGSLGWTSEGSILFYTVTQDKRADLFTLDMETMKETTIAKGLQDATGFTWAPDNSYIIYYKDDKVEDKEEGYKYFFSIEDRWPNWRERSFLYKLDVKSGLTERLTTGNLTTTLEDISLAGDNIIVGVGKPDYTQQPFSLNSLYQINLKTLTVDTLIKNNRFDISASYSPSGEKLLLLGGPSAFGTIGENVKKGQIPNNFDTQAYIFDIKTKAVEPITKNFNPKIVSGFWNPYDNNIYFLCEDMEVQDLYKYEVTTKQFTKIATNQDNLLGVSYSKAGNLAAYSAQGTNSPTVGYLLNLADGKTQQVANPNGWLSDVKLGNVEQWDFKNKRGETIKGRVYFPPTFDPSKKYPVIVYYYGGTSPVGRRWEGRYPFQYYAANGYLVYVLQPAGTTGFGQQFSAMHVNAWGKFTADDIIEGTQKFIASHPYANGKKVGCMGASYGGFTTMYLQTQTDIFATAISHAGISDITSYWGEGYWGYSYSNVASYNSYPWNNPDLYVKQSPLFMANRIKSPMLLLQGAADTNVPPGESIQMFNALKILGKKVEMVHFDDEDHFIIDFDRRTRWTKSILAWFDRYLKDQPEWWNELYPEKNY